MEHFHGDFPQSFGLMEPAGTIKTQLAKTVDAKSIPLTLLNLRSTPFEGKESACNAGDLGLIPGLGKSPGGGNGNPLQYSCLENPMD